MFMVGIILMACSFPCCWLAGVLAVDFPVAVNATASVGEVITQPVDLSVTPIKFGCIDRCMCACNQQKEKIWFTLGVG